LDWACSRSSGLGGSPSVRLWGRVWFREFLVGLRWWWIVVVVGGRFPTGFAVGGRGGRGGGFVSGGFGVGTSCHPLEESEIRGFNWMSRFAVEEERVKKFLLCGFCVYLQQGQAEDGENGLVWSGLLERMISR
jgi:hypothetical protein